MAEPIPKSGWLDRVARGMDNLVAVVSPTRAMTRLQAREAFTHFRRDAARADLDRHRVREPVRSPDSSIDQRDRLQIIREARDCEENIPFVSGLFLLFFTYLFETLTYEPDTGDAGMDSEIDAYFNEMWMGQADAFLMHAFPVLFGLSFCGSLRDGDGGLAFVDDGTMLRLAAVEADQIGEPNVTLTPQADYVAGVWLNPDGTKRGYQVYDRLGDFRYGNPQFIPAASFVYLADARRPTAKRNTSILGPLINNLRDKYEAMNTVKVTLKEQLRRAYVTYTQRGAPPINLGAPPAIDGPGGRRLASVIQHSDAGLTEYFGMGEQMEAMENRHINDNFLNFIKTIDTENCNGIHLPYGFVVDNADPGGAGVRMVLHRTSREFGRLKGKIIKPALNRIRDMVLLYAMDKGDISKHPKFQGGEWMFPPPPTADMQRESETDIAEIEAGLTTRTEIAAMWGQRQKRTVRTLAKEEKMRQDAAKEFGVDPRQIYTTAADAEAAKQPAAGNGSTAATGEPDPNKLSKFRSGLPAGAHWVTLEGRHVLIGGHGQVLAGHLREPEPTGYQADARSVGSHLDVKAGGDTGNAVHSGLEAIHSVHTDGGLENKLDVHGKSALAGGAVGEYVHTGARANEINIREDGKHKAFTTVHEVGHLLHHQIFGEGDGKFSTRESNESAGKFLKDAVAKQKAKGSDVSAETHEQAKTLGATADLQKSLANTPEVKALKKLKASGKLGAVVNDAKQDHEIFARAYSQYIAQKSQHPDLLRGLEADRNSDYGKFAKLHWSEESFKPVAEKFDALLRAKSWLHER